MSSAKIFLTGATGYIGGSVLTGLLNAPNGYVISALVRNKDQGEKLKQLGVTPVYGSLDDSDVLFEAAKAADAVVHTADADHLASAQSLVRGLKAKNSKRAVYLHTSGTGVLTFNPVTTNPFDDLDISRIHSIPPQALHKEIDSWVFENTDDITAAIIAPSTINGIGSGPFKKTSSQVIGLAKAAAARRKAGYVGRDNVVWNNVNINDLVDLYLLVLAGLLADTADHGKEGGWYFGVTHEHSWYKVAQTLAAVLSKRGLVDSTDVTPFEQQYIDNYLYGPVATYVFGSDSRAIANRSKKIGWKPSGADVYQTIEEEVEYLIKNGELPPK